MPYARNMFLRDVVAGLPKWNESIDEYVVDDSPFLEQR